MKSKNKNLFLKIYIPFVIIISIALIILQILGSKNRIGYLTDFNLEIYKTLELNNLNDIINEELDEEGIKNYLLTNENITNYVHHFRIRYYDKVFRNSDIYGVYVDLSNLPDYMKNAEMEEGGSPYGNFTSDRKTIEIEKIDNVSYRLSIKSNIIIIFIATILTILCLNTIIYFIIFIINNINKIPKVVKNIISLSDKKFIIITIFIGLVLSIFQFWLGFPGYFQEWDWYRIQEKAFNLNLLNNWDPVLYVQLLRLFFAFFGVHSFYFFLINLLCCWIAIALIIISLYSKFKNRFLILLYFTPFITSIFFYNILQIKDYIFSLHLFLLYSLIFTQLLIRPKNNLVKILLMILTGILLTITLLLRHNAIVTIYPIFILFTYLILEKSISNAKLYLLKFMTIMLFFAIILLSIVKFTPRIFLTEEQAAIDGSINAIIFNIGGMAYTSGDYSLIPKEWYLEGKNSKDLEEAYKVGYSSFNKDLFCEISSFSSLTRDIKPDKAKKIFIEYIFRHPIGYIKFIRMVGDCLWFHDFVAKSHIAQGIGEPPNNKNRSVSNRYPNYEQGIQFTDIRLKIYDFLYKISLNINNIIPISICIIIFFLSGLLWLLKNNFRNKLLLFTFCIAFSGFATALIVIMFSPSGRLWESRYIAPVLPISIISLISFLTFIYDRGGFKKFLKELKGYKNK